MPAPQPAPPVNSTPAQTETKTTESQANANETTTLKETPKYVKKKNFNFNKFILFVQIQLVSARIYARLKEFDKARSFYEHAIKKEPKVVFFIKNRLYYVMEKNMNIIYYCFEKKQDAYIELALMLKKNGDFKGAIDVYSSFPIKEKNEGGKDSKSEQRFVFI
jgi:tetratricopeptide (TPR) repeat protein